MADFSGISYHPELSHIDSVIHRSLIEVQEQETKASAATAVTFGCDPLLLMVPATLSASCAFMLPVATPPNAIVFSSERIPIPTMARVGFVMNLIGVGLIYLLIYLVG